MATNFEFYKDSLVNYLATVTPFAVRDGKIEYCKGGECARCLFDPAHCVSEKVLWLKAEHIEQPKLTKRERAFCEALEFGWIARDFDMNIWWFAKEPVNMTGAWTDAQNDAHSPAYFLNEHFGFIKDTDARAWSVEDLLKLEVEE